MDKRFPTGWVLAVWVLATYLLLGTLSAGGAPPPVLVLSLVLLLWFSVYAFRHGGLVNRDLVSKMRADLEGTLEGIKKRVAQEEDRTRAAEHEERARLEQERRRAEGARRRASGPTRDPAVSRYADMIEKKVREARRDPGEETRF